MTRIFLTLAMVSLSLMAAALVLGLRVGDLYGELSPDVLSGATLHRLMGLVAALAVVLVNSIVITYFVGTSRWCKEVVQTYHLDVELIAQSARLKRRTFPWSLGGMLVVVGVVALGGAADPGTGRPGTEDWAVIHLVGALAGLALVGWSYLVQWNNIQANHRIIDQVMHQVRHIRHDRGLETEE